MTFSSVDFPAPLRPISAIRSPAWACRVTPRRTVGPSRSSSQTPSTESSAPLRARRPRGGGAATCGERRARRRSRGERRGRIDVAGERRGRIDLGDPCGAGRRGLSVPPLGSEHAARLFDRDGRPLQPGQREQSRGRGGVGAGQPGARRLVGHEPAVAQLDHPVGGGQAALQAVLGEQDRGPPLLVEPAQDAEQLVARDRVQLRGRLVEQQQPRPPRQRGGERDALQLAAAQLVSRPVQQPPEAERQRRLLDTPRHGRRGPAEVLQGERDLRPHRPHHDLRLGVLEERPGDRGDLGRPVRTGVEPAGLHAPAERPAVEVRHEPARGPQQRRLPRSRATGDQHQLPGLDRQRDVGERRRRAAPG